MKFLVDAQLPVRLAQLLLDSGHDVVHSSKLPQGNRTPDDVLAELADAEGRVVVTKDRDFEIGHLLNGTPGSLLLVTTGNVGNNDLLDLFGANLALIEAALDQNSYVELSATTVIVHGGAAGR